MARNVFRILNIGLIVVFISMPTLTVQANREEKWGKYDPNTVVARINGKKIFMREVINAAKSLPQHMKNEPVSRLFPLVVDSLIVTHLTVTEGRRLGIDKRHDVKRRLIELEKRVIEDITLSEHVRKNLTDAKLKKLYREFLKGFKGKTEIKARHILLKTEQDAKQVIKELNSGADFAELAKKKSTGPSKTQGGDLGFFGRGRMVAEFEKAAFSMKKGQHSAIPTKSRFGWHVIKVENKRAAKAPSKEEAMKQLRAQEAHNILVAFIEDLKSKTKIEVFNLNTSTLRDH